MSIVKGRISKVGYDKSYPFSPPALPIADELQYGPVLVSCDDFEKWLSAQQEEPPEGGASSSQVTGSSVPDATSTSRRQRGRRLGTGSWAGADDPLLARMRELIEAGIAKSANDAAGQLAGEARGAGTINSKRHRLGKRYRARYSLE